MSGLGWHREQSPPPPQDAAQRPLSGGPLTCCSVSALALGPVQPHWTQTGPESILEVATCSLHIPSVTLCPTKPRTSMQHSPCWVLACHEGLLLVTSWWPISGHLPGVLWAPNPVFCSLHVLETEAPGLTNLQASNKHEREREKKENMISYFT